MCTFDYDLTRTTKSTQANQSIKLKIKEIDYENLSPYVIGLGFEPRTDSLEGYCSIQLSYPTDP